MKNVRRTELLTGKRLYPFGVKFYGYGSEQWEELEVMVKAEEDCKGCWYGFTAWRKAVNKSFMKNFKIT